MHPDNPIAQLLMGHMAQDPGGPPGPQLPPIAHMAAPGAGAGGPPGPPGLMGLPPGGPNDGSSGGGSDRSVAETAAHQLLAATHQASDPGLKASFATALAALHKWLANDDKEHHQALAGKLSPRLMAQAHGNQAA